MREFWPAMDEKRRLPRNVIANVVQVLASAGLLFALYRYINVTLGVEQLGIWSVVLATASASRLADLGLSAGVTRFVARDRARGDLARAGQVVDTALLMLMVVVGAALPLLYPLIAGLLPHLFDVEHLTGALEILPYALASLWLTIVAAVFQGGLDGCQRMDLRAGLVVAGQIAMLASAIVLVPRFGLVGLAWAQIGQGLLLVIGGRAALRRALPPLPRLPRQWSRPVLREMLGYGTNVQVATVFMLLLDPVAKALMARFGGPAAAGYFEMANQVLLRVRALIVSANQAIVPHVAALAATEPARLTHLYRDNMHLLVFVTLPAFALLIAWAGGFSWLLIGAYQPEFVFLITLLSVAWGANIFAGPAYFTNLGTGQVGWNTLSHMLMGALNAALGWLLGVRYGANGVAFGYAIALIAGSAMLIGVYGYRHRVRCRAGLTQGHLPLIAASLTVAVFGWLMPLRKEADEPALALIGLLVPLLVLGASVWYHPVRRRLFESWSARRVRI
ncbi:MAG: lipopolysaccharide biosynthesis protein [Pseudomonadota bacterium]